MNPSPQIGPYTIQSNLGGGGMADVYLAWDNANRWPVALKVLRGGAGKDGKLQKRFEREAAALTRLRHSHIVQIYATGQAADGRTYIAMEYVGGGDLEELLARTAGGKLPVSEAVYLMRRVAGAIAYAHGQGVIHRDLKPSNILLRADTGEPVVVDLGIAAFAGAKPLTGTMESLGTPQYMAPEQAGDGAKADGRADVYAIGVMLHELLTGQTPFAEESGWSLLLRKQATDAPSILSLRRDLDPRLAAVVDACLRRDPAARYQSAGALAAALDAFLPADARPPAPVPVKGRGRTATPRTPSTPGTRPSAVGGRRSLFWAVGAALVMVLALALIISALGGGGGETEPTTSPGTVVVQGTEEEETAEPSQPTSTLAGPVEDTPFVASTDGTTEPIPVSPPLTRTSTRQPTTVSTATTARVTRDVYTRSGPGLSYPIVGDLSGNEVVTVLGRDVRGDWFQVDSPNGPVWVSKGYITEASGSVAVVTNIPALPTFTQTASPAPNATIAPSTYPPITLINPRLAACPPTSSAPAYSANDTMEFRWEWPADPPAGAYLEVRAGMVGSLTSQGRVDPAIHRDGYVWTFPVSGNAIFDPGNGAYQWAVYLIDESGRPLLNSTVSCFGLVGVNTESTEEPGQPPIDSDGDGILDPDDDCPFEKPGPYPDPNRPGCPGSYP